MKAFGDDARNAFEAWPEKFFESLRPTIDCERDSRLARGTNFAGSGKPELVSARDKYERFS